MDDGKWKQDYEARAQKVRAGLKQWEADWAKSHDGKKPGREDIKNNPTIAQKYKDYNKLRDIISGKAAPPSKEPGSTKRKSDAAPSPVETPHKKAKQFETPSKGQAYVDSNGFMNSPAISRKLFSPATVTSLGPTPQRDGKVLGLFDLLVEKELGRSPHSSGEGKARNPHAPKVHATPSKRRDEDGAAKLGHTPSSRERGGNLFATPLKKKKDKGGAEAGTPTSVSRLTFDTPAFLRRQKLPVLDENASFDAPAPLRLPRKPFARGLSEIVANLRKVEEELADEELEALREAQSGEAEPPRPPARDILEPDKETSQLLSGFDDEAKYDGVVEEDGSGLKVYKKKGQKRTTKKVNIKPTRHKRPTTAADEEAGESDNEFVDDGEDGQKKGMTENKDGVVKKAARKVNQLAHTNFQRLKLRNNGAKGGPGHNSRFRRRR